MTQDIPIFKFALREDVKDDSRFIPTRGEPKATGWDVRAAMVDRKPLILKPFDLVKIPLGVRGFCPDGWWFEIKPRSSSFTKKNLHALYGTVDETYEGELIFACQYIPEATPMGDIHPNLTIEFGDAIAQIIPIKRQVMMVEAVSNEEYATLCSERGAQRGAGGFGSTGK